MPQSGGINWRPLNGAEVPPSPNKGPIPEKNLHIKDVIQSATREELVKLGNAWEVGTLGSFVLARIAQLENAPMMNQIDHYVRLTQKVTLPPMQVHKTVSVTKIPILSKRLNMMMESLLA